MQAWRCCWLMRAVLLGCLAGCGLDGGRGSSGFDISENAAISHVLETQECLGLGQLTICPADQKQTAPPTPTAATPTPTVGSGPTATPDPGTAPRIDTGVAAGASIACIRPNLDAPCTLSFGFATTGFPAGTTFGVASRLSMESAWQLAAMPVLDPASNPPRYQSTIAVQLTPETVEAQIQFAVLAFLSPPADIPAEFSELALSGADSAFVTDEFLLEVITTEPPPTPTAEDTPAATPTGDVTEPPATPTPTEGPPPLGPIVTYFGVARADNLALAPTEFDGDGRPIYVRQVGSGMSLIIEGQPGPDGGRVGVMAFDAPDRFGDLQIIVSHALGDGSAAVCDAMQPTIGGIPATNPFAFSDDAAVIAASNDLSCRVDGGAGTPRGRGPSEACTRDRSGEFEFVDSTSTLQFCLPIAGAWSFPRGDTRVGVRLRDERGELSAVREIVVRIADAPPTATPPPEPTATAPVTEASPTAPVEQFSPSPTRANSPPPTPTSTPVVSSGPLITHVGIARADNLPVPPVASDDAQRPIYVARFGHSVSIVVEGRPGSSNSAVGSLAYNAEGDLSDLQMIVSRALGDGSTIVCDKVLPDIGGIPAVTPFAFSNDPATVDAINDLGCRVDDGTGEPRGRANSYACTRDLSGEYRFVDLSSTMQFCLPIASGWPFAIGDTIVAVRLRDVHGGLSTPREIVIRVPTL